MFNRRRRRICDECEYPFLPRAREGRDGGMLGFSMNRMALSFERFSLPMNRTTFLFERLSLPMNRRTFSFERLSLTPCPLPLGASLRSEATAAMEGDLSPGGLKWRTIMAVQGF